MDQSKNPFYVGVDIVESDRITKAIDRHGERILHRLFTPSEIEYCRRKRLYGHHYAARFAAKEAVVKAATPVCNLHYKQIEVLRAESGMPSVRIHDCPQLEGKEFRLSISHSNQSAVAMVLFDSTGLDTSH